MPSIPGLPIFAKSQFRFRNFSGEIFSSRTLLPPSRTSPFVRELLTLIRKFNEYTYQSAGQGLESSGARSCQGEPEQRDASGYRVIPATRCAFCALSTAPTTRGMTCEQPGTDHEQLKVQPTAHFSMSFLVSGYPSAAAFLLYLFFCIKNLLIFQILFYFFPPIQ